MVEFIVNNWLSIVTLIGGAIAFMVEKNKRTLEVDSAKVDVMDKMRAVYLNFVDDSEKKMLELRETIARLEKELEVSLGENVKYKAEIKVLLNKLKDADVERHSLAARITSLEDAKATKTTKSNGRKKQDTAETI